MNKLLNGRSKTITGAAFIIAIASLLSRFLGIIRDRVLAGQFGAGIELDIYYAAFRIPDFIYNLIVLGALSAGFIPILAHYFSECEEHHSKEHKSCGWRFVNNILNISILLIVLISITSFIFAPTLMSWITPGFDGDQLHQVVQLTRLMFLSPLLLALSSIYGGVLQIHNRFLMYSIAPLLYNLGIIVGAIFFVPIWGILGLAYGVIVGAFFHMIVQYLGAHHLGYRYSWVLDFKDKEIKHLFTLMTPRTLGIAVTQLNLLVITIIASKMQTGSLTVFNLSNNLQYFPIGIFGISLAIASFPALSRYAASEDFDQFVKTFSNTVNIILFCIIPVSVLMIILNDQIVRVILGSGKFSWQDTVMTSETLRFFCLSLFAQSLIPLFSRAFYALKNTRIPFICAFWGFVVNLILCLILSRKMGVAGLALAFSFSSIVNLMLLHIFLTRKLGGLDEVDMMKRVIQVMIASLVLAITTQATKLMVAPIINFQSFQGIFLHGFISGIVGIIFFIFVCELLKIVEYLQFKKAFRAKVNAYISPYVKSNINDGGV